MTNRTQQENNHNASSTKSPTQKTEQQFYNITLNITYNQVSKKYIITEAPHDFTIWQALAYLLKCNPGDFPEKSQDGFFVKYDFENITINNLLNDNHELVQSDFTMTSDLCYKVNLTERHLNQNGKLDTTQTQQLLVKQDAICKDLTNTTWHGIFYLTTHSDSSKTLEDLKNINNNNINLADSVSKHVEANKEVSLDLYIDPFS